MLDLRGLQSPRLCQILGVATSQDTAYTLVYWRRMSLLPEDMCCPQKGKVQDLDAAKGPSRNVMPKLTHKEQ